MGNRNLIRELGITEELVEQETARLVGGRPDEELSRLYDESVREFQVDTILHGKILNVIGDEVLVDVGYKSEGVVPISEFYNPREIKIGDTIEVFLEDVEDREGVIRLSKQKADRIRGWERIITQNKEGDVVRGRVIRKIKGGLLVDVGVPVFLPASQVDIRRVEDIGTFLGREIEAKIIKIDEKRMNIIVSRRKLLEEMRDAQKKELLTVLKEGDIRMGVVKNIADFGAFVDLGGIDGLLHITDMSWGRVNHPSEIVAIDQRVEIKILRIDRTTERIALGLKQLTPNPWDRVPDKYPVGSRIRGKVVNLLPYGAFVELETGVEGLVHVSEMSWTKKVSNPSEVVSLGDLVEVVVLNINKEKQEISLGMKQTEVNPWTLVGDKYKSGMRVSGRIRNTTNYGAFVELEEGIDGLLHVSDMSWTKKILHPSEVVKKGEKVDVVVLSCDPDKKRIALGLKQLLENPWETRIPEKYPVGAKVDGKVTKLVSFGAFVELEPELEGLLHISKVADQGEGKVLGVGDEVEVDVIKLEPSEGKIGLSLVRVVKQKPPAAKAALSAEKEIEKAPAGEAAPVGAGSPAAEPPAAAVGDGPPAAPVPEGGTPA
jgi:small subunit ribosomal protein S1